MDSCSHWLNKFTSIIMATVLLSAIVLVACSPTSYSGKTESITVGTMVIETDALILIADEQKFFATNSLNVNLCK